jgi:hypothetical protein
MQEVVLALLAKEPSHGYDLRARLRHALGPLGDGMNAGQIYVTLGRLEKAGLVISERSAGLPDRPDRKVYALTATGSSPTTPTSPMPNRQSPPSSSTHSQTKPTPRWPWWTR